jgi:mannose-6-phosphate isomerase-like protein (cupin superfamily)
MSAPVTDLTTAEPRGMDETLGGYVWLPRMIDKARAKLADTLGTYVHPCPVDRTALARMRVDYGTFKRIILATTTDAEVLAALREVEGLATPQNAWFDPVAREEELQRSDHPTPPHVVPGAVLEGFAHGLIGVTLVRVSLGPGATRAAHRHPYDEVVLVEAGQGVAHAGSDDLAIGAGDAVTLPARVVHAFSNTGAGELRLLEIHADGRVLEEPAS